MLTRRLLTMKNSASKTTDTAKKETLFFLLVFLNVNKLSNPIAEIIARAKVNPVRYLTEYLISENGGINFQI